jgi:two-component system, NarL family, nitrate/nitrite response regulator NarL
VLRHVERHSCAHDQVTRVVVVHRVRLYRDGLRQILARRRRIEVVGAAADWEEACALVRELEPDVALLDLGMPGALEAARELVATAPAVKLVALGVTEAEADVIACAEAGMAGYVTRDATVGECAAALEAAAHGELACSPKIAAALFDRIAALSTSATEEPPEPETQLTRRERQILELIDEGLSNQQIASQLSIELPTVKNHVHHILEKLRVNRRGEAAARMRRRGRAPARLRN